MKTAQQYELELKEFFRKLEEKVEKKARVFLTEFIFEATNELIDFTPLGDSALYSEYYYIRRLNTGLREEAGLASNNWQITFNSPANDFLRVYSEGQKGIEFLNQIDKMKSKFELGDSIYVINNTPYLYDITERGSGGNAVIDPNDWLKATVKNQSAVQGYFISASVAADRVNYTF